MTRNTFFSTLFISATATTLIGCGPAGTSQQAPASSAGGHDDHAEHDLGEHGHEGPHHGHLIELGRDHLHHAELIENEEKLSIVVYILDEKMEALPIESESISLNLMVDDQAKTFQLGAAEAQDGKSCQFRSTNSEPFEALHEHDATGRLSVIIDGKPYHGKVEHGHDEHEHHEGEDHDGPDHHEGEDHDGPDHHAGEDHDGPDHHAGEDHDGPDHHAGEDHDGPDHHEGEDHDND